MTEEINSTKINLSDLGDTSGLADESTSSSGISSNIGTNTNFGGTTTSSLNSTDNSTNTTSDGIGQISDNVNQAIDSNYTNMTENNGIKTESNNIKTENNGVSIKKTVDNSGIVNGNVDLDINKIESVDKTVNLDTNKVLNTDKITNNVVNVAKTASNDSNTTNNNINMENTNININSLQNVFNHETEHHSTESKKINIIDELLRRQIISKDQLEVANREQKNNGNKEDIASILVRMGFISDRAISEIINASSDVKDFDLKSLILDQKLVRKIPKGFATQNKVIAVDETNNTVMVATTDVFNIIIADQVKRFFSPSQKIQLIYSPEADIINAVDKYYDYDLSIDGILKEIESGGADANDEQSAVLGDYRSPMVRLVDAILTDAIRSGASDLHFEPENFFLRLRYRIDGKMEQIKAFHKDYWSSMVVRIKIMSGMNIAETRKAQDGRINAQILGRNIDFRVSSQPTVDGENIVMRILDERQSILDLDKLGYFPRTQNILKKCIQKPEGIVVITGPTGSGKTTTLYTVLSMINDIEKNIMTLENPVEYRIPLIRQTNISPESGVDFADGIRTLMRQDPDVILVGEIRDKETAIAAVQAAMTGHQVYSSLHTNDAFSAIPRLMQIGVEPFLLSGSLICVIAQRLVRKLCPHCKQKYTITDQEKKIIGRILGENIATKVVELYKPVGCDKCRNRGYSGRMAVAEIIDVDKELDEMIVQKTTKKEMMNYLNKNGFISMQADGLQKVIMGYTSLEELIRVVDMTSAMDV